MPPLRTIAVWFACALPLAASSNAPAAEEASRVAAKIVSAYEKGEPVDEAATKAELLVLSAASSYRGISNALARVSAFQKVRTPLVPVCPEIPAPERDPKGCVLAAALVAAKDLGIVEGSRQNSAASLYLALYLGPRNGPPIEAAAARERADKALFDPRLSEKSAARMHQVMAQGDLLRAPGDAAVAGRISALPSAGAGPGYRDASVRAVPVNARKVPSVSERLSASAREDEVTLIRTRDDGTWTTALGRSLTQVKKTGSGLLSALTSGETWRRAADGAVGMVSNPGQTVRSIPGALWDGVKADINNAGHEIGNFIENPTPYRGVAMVGSVGLVASNVFGGGSAKTLLRQSAKVEIFQGARQAERLADNLVGAVDDLDFTLAAANKSPYNKAALEWRAKGADGRPTVVAGDLKGRIGVNQEVYKDIEDIGRQRGSDCVRFGIASCSIANGTPMTTGRIEEVVAAGIRERKAKEVKALKSIADTLRARGETNVGIDNSLVTARSHLILAETGSSAAVGMAVEHIMPTLRQLNIPHRSLGYDLNARMALSRGEVSPAVMRYQGRIDAELQRGNAVMAALYTGTDGAHAYHAVTILGKGRDAAGRVVYEVYDSNVGRVAQIPVDVIRPYAAVVVGRS